MNDHSPLLTTTDSRSGVGEGFACQHCHDRPISHQGRGRELCLQCYNNARIRKLYQPDSNKFTLRVLCKGLTMKIERAKKATTPLGELRAGMVFEFGEKVFVKIQSADNLNAVCFAGGDCIAYAIAPDQLVTPYLNAVLQLNE